MSTVATVTVLAFPETYPLDAVMDLREGNCDPSAHLMMNSARHPIRIPNSVAGATFAPSTASSTDWGVPPWDAARA